MTPSEQEFTSTGIDSDFAAPADWARLYRLRGIQVVPAFMPGEHAQWKRPLLKSWTEFQEALVPDEVFAPWYGPAGQYVGRPNMGIITGRASNNLFVIDLDHHKNAAAAAWWQALMAVHNNGLDLDTVQQITGGGGSQKIYRAPPGWVAPTFKTNIGVDIRGQGGFAMLAPSLHESGRPYEWVEGCSPDDIPVTDAPDWLLEAVEKLVREHGGVAVPNGKAHHEAPQGQYDPLSGRQTDGRETYMRDFVWAAVLDWNLECPIRPSERESLAKEQEKYVVYEGLVAPQRSGLASHGQTKTDQLEAEGRGPSLFHVKWAAAMKKWDNEVYLEARRKDRPKPRPAGWSNDPIKPPPGGGPVNQPISGLLEALDVRQIKSHPDPVWLVEDLINEQSLGFIFGPPGSLKTFIALDVALTLSTGLPTWWGRKVNKRGAVIYLCREGVASLKFRIMAWEDERKIKADDAPFFLIKAPLNFMQPADVAVLLATVEGLVARTGVPVEAIFVDTVSRVLPGAKENQQEDMSLFIGACEALQTRFSCVVIGVHHTNKNGGIRGSTVIPGAGDFLIETRREPGSMTGSIVLQKVKDGEDGVELPFKVTKVDLAGITPRTSLVVDPTGKAKAAAAISEDGLPDVTVCREILAALALAWFQKVPWCKAANGARPAVDMIVGRYQLKREVAKRLLMLWLANGIIEIDVYDKRNKLSGYRKVTDL